MTAILIGLPILPMTPLAVNALDTDQSINPALLYVASHHVVVLN